MRKKYIFGKKLYISVLTSILVLLTTVATTFAWVGVFANSTFESFDFKLKSTKIDGYLDDYSIQVSLDGINFSDSINEIDLKKQILLNWGYQEENLSQTKAINKLFAQLNLEQCTTVPIIENNKIVKLDKFTNLYSEETKRYYKFDFYVSTRKNFDENNHDSSFLLDVFINKDMITGRIKNKDLVNPFTYPSDFINPYDNMISHGTYSLPLNCQTVKANEAITSARVNSADASRVAFEKYKVVDKGHPEQYAINESPLSSIIYQSGYDYPVYNSDNDSYCFGGILDTPYNLSIGYFNSTEYFYVDWHYWDQKLPNEIWTTRGVDSSTKDLVLSSKNNHLIDSQNPNEKIGIDKMMKITAYFWFEGWDADCFNAINLSPVDINITLNMINEEEF